MHIQSTRLTISAASSAALMPIPCQTPMSESAVAATTEDRLSPMKRKTAFSSRNWIVRQFSDSAIRAWADWITGARKPRNSPATTTASTPSRAAAAPG